MTAIYIILTVVILMSVGFIAQAAIIRSRRQKWMELRLSDEERHAIAQDFVIFDRIS